MSRRAWQNNHSDILELAILLIKPVYVKVTVSGKEDASEVLTQTVKSIALHKILT